MANKSQLQTPIYIFCSNVILTLYHQPATYLRFVMATAYFPRTVPMSRKTQKMIDTRRTISTFVDSQIFDVNVNNRPVASFPRHYLQHIRRFIWHEDSIRIVLRLGDQLNIPCELENNIKMILWYMDEVFKRLVAEIPRRIQDTAEYHSRTFDSYLKIEYWVGRHEPTHLRDYRRANDLNIDQTNVDQFGESSCTLCHFFILTLRRLECV